ncbi:MAG TPA: G1 family glutamic endopeptidase [Solirubrobacteraceae bacterium]|nr:G1 family glutamic endopeptidase [Solirubrobacteraceae bacterium]
MNRRNLRALAVAGTAAAGLSAVSAGAARADVTPSFVPEGSASASPAVNGTDPFYGGYTGMPAAGISSAGFSFIVPSVTCPVDAQDILGEAVYDSNGNLTGGAGVVIDCSGGTPTYSLLASTFTANAEGPVSPGDRIVVAVGVSSTNTVAKVIDEASHVRVRAADGAPEASGAPAASFHVGIFNDSGTTADYGTATFQGNQVNGKHLGQLDPTALDNEPGTDVQSTTGPVKPTGLRFTLTFTNAT